jgi:hypothetical protein
MYIKKQENEGVKFFAYHFRIDGSVRREIHKWKVINNARVGGSQTQAFDSRGGFDCHCAKPPGPNLIYWNDSLLRLLWHRLKSLSIIVTIKKTSPEIFLSMPQVSSS